MDDLILFAALSDVQSAMLRLLMLQVDAPQEMWEFSAEIMDIIEQELGKWEHYAQLEMPAAE
jgi:hypothetical protein